METIGKMVAAVVAKRDSASRPSRSGALAKLAKTDSDGLPIVYDRAIDLELPKKVFSHWIPTVGPRAKIRELTAEERSSLEIRAASLEVCLTPFRKGDPDVEAAIYGMFGGFRAMRARGEDALATLEVVTAILAEFPAWAIIKACLKIAKTNLNWALNDGQIYAEVKEIVRLYKFHHDQAHALLDAPVEAPPKPIPVGSRQTAAEPTEDPVRVPGDGKHFDRIKADLEARKARSAAQSPQEVSGGQSS